jgi:curved DNA-binding protein CbpA
MPQPKSLSEHIADGTWRARLDHHRELLDTSPAPASERLARIQAEYQAADNPELRRWLARQFQDAINTPSPAEQEEREADRAAFALEEAEFAAITLGEGEEISLDSIAEGIDESDRQNLARDLRYGAITGQDETYAQIAGRLGVSRGKAWRLVNKPQTSKP